MIHTKTAIFRKLQSKDHVLSGTAIKALALGLMVIDHVHQIFYTQGVPAWFSWLGRPVATLFMFLCAEGFYYTQNRKRYMLQLLVGSFLMSGISMGLSRFMPLESVALINNMFGTLFMSTFYMLMIDLLRTGITARTPGKILLALGGMILPWFIGLGMLAVISKELLSWLWVMLLLFIPNPLIVEGGFALVFMGVLFYILRKYRLAQMGIVVLIGILSSLTAKNAQWLMVSAIVPMWLYNGQRGRGGKYFFYIFYPVHLYILYIIAFLIQRET
ncbi:MAG: conjugal transfer protein TraX [Treponema sp.]|jgi:hypothetical protein|nr:conjugal transfer protein TraX [Treponema sp.]